MNQLSTVKAAIRAEAIQRRNALPPGIRRDFSSAINNRILALQAFREAQTVMAYCSFASEVETAPLLSAILHQGKSLLLPRVNRAAGTLDLYKVTDLQNDICCGIWGIGEPGPHCLPSPLSSIVDLVLIPGVAFDRKGTRIGYGKGYYDKLLTEWHQAGLRPTIVGLAFEVQVWETLPADLHDVPINLLVTESGQ